MDLIELSVEVDSESAEPVSEAFCKYGCERVLIEKLEPYSDSSVISVKGYITNDDTANKIRSDIDLVVRLLALLRPIGSLKVNVLLEEDWSRAWQKHFNILHIGSKIVICPSWLKYERSPGEAVVIIDPGMAFGTGLHPTTRMCLEALDYRVKDNMNIVDIGTGSGVLSIAAAKLGAAMVLALDVDKVAVKVAKENVVTNRISQIVEVREGTLPQDNWVGIGEMDLAVANMSVVPILQLAGNILATLKTGGVAVLAGILDDQAEEVKVVFEKLPAILQQRTVQEDWVTLVFHKT